MRASTITEKTAKPHSLRILYGTQTGTASRFAESLAADAKSRGVSVIISDLKDCDPEDTLTLEVCVYLLATSILHCET